MANLNLNLDVAKGNSDVVQLVELGNGVVQITMRDEEKSNIFSLEIIEGLYRCFEAVAENKSYKVVILTGSGNYFSSGGTQEILISISKGEIKCSDADFFRIALDCPIPVIAAMQGHAIGGGLVLGLYADLVVLSQESIYTANFMKYGFTPGMGCTFIAPEKLGALGLEMMYTARNYRGKELAERGVSFPVVPRKDVLKVAKDLAYELSEKPRLSLITLKKHLQARINKELPEFVEKEVAMHDITFGQSEVVSKIDQSFDEMKGVSSKLQNSSQEPISNQEKILLELQSGQLSLEDAEQLLLGNQEEESTDNLQSESINLDSSEEILSLMSSGEISLETAEKLLLEAVEPEILNPGQEGVSDIASTDIAIIGMSCRYPGANNWQEFWENLKNGVDSVSEPPPGRWEEKNWYHPDPEHPGTSYSKCAGFLDEIDKFDPLFFKISPEEARFVEPQQRIFLEEAYHAIEDAGYASDSLRGKQCGVFVGASTGDYINLLSNSGLNTHRFVLTGNILSIVPARIAYFLDLKGPVAAIDTSCSSSLVAVHQACESIQRGESEIAIAGGINILSTADLQITSSKFQMISPEGRCKTFDAEASGITWSEGCGVVLLKRYSQAIQDKDHIYGVIKGTGVNYDGNTNGISAPSSQSQASLEEAVYKKFGINPETISYVEAHGTATPLGDPIEVEALTESFSKWTKKKRFCAIGSVKTNIGHGAMAAGVSGLIKTALCLKNQKLVPSLHFNQPNPHIDFENSPFYVNTEFKDWEVLAGKPRRAAVSSLGFSGTNAHLVIEEAPSEVKSQNVVERPIHLFTLSAKTEKALEELVSRYQNYLETHPHLELADICYTASTGRTHFNHRLGAIASDPKELSEKLLAWKTQEQPVGVFSGQQNRKSPKIAFLFTGQGSQYANMGRKLYEQAPVFRQTLEKCNQILKPYLDVPLLEIIDPLDTQKSTSDVLNQTAYTQPALFAIEYALFKLWESWGIKPDVVMGHSVGEYVAATVAGVFSLEDGLKLIAMRGKLMQKLPSGGKMVSIMASESQVTEAIREYSSQVTIAAVNGPESIVISGESGAIAKICSHFESEGVKSKQLEVSHAFHSQLMEPMLAGFEAVANQITYHQPRIPIISNLTGTKADNSIATAEYWVSHVRQPVKFAQSMETLHEQGYKLFLEIGPKPILLGMGRQCLPEEVGVWLPSLRPGVEEWQQMLSSLGQLYVQGVKIDGLGFDQKYYRQKVVLPTYPFQRERYWVESNKNSLKKQYLSTSPNIHPLLGQKLNCAGKQEIFESLLGENSPAYLNHYRVFDRAMLPTTAYLEMAQAAGNYKLKTPNLVVEDLIIQQGLRLPVGELISAQTIIAPSDNQSYQFQIFSQQEQQHQEEPKWILHAIGKIRTAQTDATRIQVDLEKYKAECSQPIEVKQHYQQYRQLGLDYGSSFQGIYELWSGENQALAQIKLPEELIAQTIDYQFHPALLDAALQVIYHALPEVESDQTYLTVGVEQFRVYRSPGLSLWAYASVSRSVESQRSLTAQVKLVSPEGEIIATVEGLEVGVRPIDWSAWQETIQTTSETSKSEFVLKLKAATPDERRLLLVAHVRRHLALLLGINDPESISLETGFFDLGMDSLTSVELRNKLQTDLDCLLPSSLAFDYPNIQSLTDYLEETVLLLSDDTESNSETPEAILEKDSLELEVSERLFSEVHQLSEDEIDLAVDEAIDELDRLLQ
ncbi:polyketide synthase [Roseofilum sp. BLCC_M154]|uniref:Polyketide synthase n=1 Tax=Roseofilum acuticapitatum BLCC-M154 TaxID=3022444 RepID=A0ABT7AZH6_9CYAN|nr:polyketide synthase [Roseofilum acuticapitatum]MDJ1172317.1 polyketide synthase [Roseofilum acuticapitatum BLCC-M154]